MKVLKYLGVLLLISSYTIFIWNLIQNGFTPQFSSLLNTAWILGTASLIVNAIYAIKINIDEWIFSVFGTCGLFWLAPFLIDFDSTIGVPSLVVFLILGIYIHFQDIPTKEL